MITLAFIREEKLQNTGLVNFHFSV